MLKLVSYSATVYIRNFLKDTKGVLTMIYASLNAKKGNYQYPAAIATALEFLAKPETAELPVGRYELDGDNIFVLIQDQTTAPVENKRAESHRN